MANVLQKTLVETRRAASLFSAPGRLGTESDPAQGRVILSGFIS